MKSILIKDTTVSERIALIKKWQEPDDGFEDSGIDLFDMYADYINGKREISEINASFNEGFYEEEDLPNNDGCGSMSDGRLQQGRPGAGCFLR